RCARNQVFGVPANRLGVALAPSYVDVEVAAFRPAQLLKDLRKSCEQLMLFRIAYASVHQYADAPHALLLRACHQRPRRRRAAEQGDELSPARASTVAQ